MNNPIDLSVYQLNQTTYPSLRECVQRLVQRHLATIGAKYTNNLYELVSLEMEQALIERVLDYTDGNESRTAKILELVEVRCVKEEKYLAIMITIIITIIIIRKTKTNN